MLMMVVYYHCENGMRDAFLKALEKEQIAKRCQAEPGNLQYDYFLPHGSENTVLLLEKWESEEAQNVHLSTENFSVLTEIKKTFVVSVDIERYVV